MENPKDEHDHRKPACNCQVDQLKCYGFLRDVLQDQINYAFVILIIIQYFKQECAKYFDEYLHADYKQRMAFGDIVRLKSEELKCLDLQNLLIDAGNCVTSSNLYSRTTMARIEIPLQICKYFDNAHLYYSKLSSNFKTYKGDDFRCDVILYVRHNEQHLVQLVGGALEISILK